MKLFRLLSVAITILAFTHAIPVRAVSPFDGTEHINLYSTSITINTDGSMHAQERIAYDFSDTDRHGIYRDLPFIRANDAGKQFSIDFSDFRVQSETGEAYTFTESRSSDAIQLKIGDANRTITGKHTYDIGYTARGALTYFPAHDELYWNAVGATWQVPVAKATVTVSLPNGVVQGDVRVTCFTGPQGSAAQDCVTTITSDRTVLVETTKPLDSYEGLAVVVGFPKGIVAVLEPRELVPFFETTAGKIALIVLGVAAILWYIVAPIFVIRKWWTSGRDPKPGMGEAKAWFSPPKNPHHRALTPAETGTLVDERADLRDIYASIVDLARRGYLTIIETKKNEFDLEKTKDGKGDADVLPFERELLDGIFASGDRISIKAVDLTKTLEKVKGMLYESLVTDKFFPGNPNTLRGWYIALAVVAFIFVNPILFLVALTFGQSMPRKTLFGAEQAAIARSLRNFLTSQDKKLAFQAKNQMMFEKLLPFAVAFGVEEIWAGRFKSLGIKNPDWYQSSTGGRFNSVVFAHSLGAGMSGSFAASIAAHSSTGHSSGFSGGGSSGGGGGGGGGGSW
ncbi:MAG: DUF2207 domain-containing protein [Patescibacteria group bacterium]